MGWGLLLINIRILHNYDAAIRVYELSCYEQDPNILQPYSKKMFIRKGSNADHSKSLY